MITFLLGFFGYYDKKIQSFIGTKNLLYLPYLTGYKIYLDKKLNSVPTGIYCFTGKQGSGKTLSLIYTAYQLKNKYNYINFVSNMNVNHFINFHKFEQITYLKDTLCLCDEMGIVCNSKKSKNINEDIIKITAQNRKNHRLILTTAQQHYQINKDVRTQCSYVIQVSHLGALFINRWYVPHIDEEGNSQLKRPSKITFFIATKKLFDSYNSWEVIN